MEIYACVIKGTAGGLVRGIVHLHAPVGGLDGQVHIRRRKGHIVAVRHQADAQRHLAGGVDQLIHRNKLLLHRRQIDSLDGRLRTKGLALVPLELYFDEHNRVKMTLGVGRGKKLYDKRHDMAKRQSDRDIQRALKERNR